MITETFSKSDRRRIPGAVYWTVTILVAMNFAAGGATVLLGVPASTEVFVRLGYPGYFGTYLAVWQLLAVAAILIPVPRVLREWAYAGLMFDTLSAAYSLSATASPFVQMLPALFVLVLVTASYCSWRQRHFGIEG